MQKPSIVKFDKISEKARERVYSEVLQHFKKNPNSPWSGRGLVELEKTLKSFYASIGAEYNAVFRDTLPETMKIFYDNAVKEIKIAGLYKGIINNPDPKRIKYFLDSSFVRVAMKTDKMCFDHIQSLRSLSADVFREMSITGGTRREISKRLLVRAMEIKGFEFIDISGLRWQHRSYFNMLARTELMNAGRASYDDKMAEEGFDVMKLSTSGHSCDKCASFEGQLFSLSGATSGLPSKADLEAAGVFHPNCTHSYSAVPDYIRKRNYNADGTAKGDDVFPTITSDTMEPGQRPASQQTQKEKRQRQLDLAYDNRINSWAKEMQASGVSLEVVTELKQCYTKNIAKFGKPPKISLTNSDIAYFKNSGEAGQITLNQNPNSWSGHPIAARHEFGHWLDSRTRLTKANIANGDYQKFIDASQMDWALLKKQSNGFLRTYNERYFNDNGKIEGGHWQTVKQKLFGKTSGLNLKEQKILRQHQDTIGNLTNGNYGGGHLKSYYKRDVIRQEAFAQAYSAYTRNDLVFKEQFPNMWDEIEKILKK